MPTDLHFLRPAWFWLLIPLALLLWRLLRHDGDGDSWRRVVDPHLLSHLLVDADGGVRRLPLALLAAGWLLVTVALAGPVWQQLPQPVYQAQQYRVVVLDISPSMNATDLAPSRLAHARYEVLDLLRRFSEGQTALIAYGAEPFIVSPLTTDVATIAAQVPRLETGLLPVQGLKRTDRALEEAGRLLAQAGAPHGRIILVTDNLDHPAAAAAAAGQLRTQGYQVSVLGVGTEKGAPVPQGGGGFAKDPSGAIRLSRLDRDALQALAVNGDGVYTTASAADRDIEALVDNAATQRVVSGSQQAQTQADQWREEGPWLLLLLLPVAALAFRRGWLSPLLVLIVLAPPQEAQALTWADLWSTPDQQAMRKLEAGEAAAAASQFRQPQWQAAAQYQAGNYEEALQALQGQAADEVAYNQGNTLARLGRLEEAVEAYDQALATDPDNADARHNRDLVKSLLERQKQASQSEQQRQQDNEQDQSPSNQQSQSNAQSQSSDQSQSNAQSQDSQQSDEASSNQQESAGDDKSQSASEGQSQASSNGQSETRPEESAGTNNQNQQDQNQQDQQQQDQQQQDQQAVQQSSPQHDEQAPADADRAAPAQNADKANRQPQTADMHDKADGDAQTQAQTPEDRQPGPTQPNSRQPGLADLMPQDSGQRTPPAGMPMSQVNPENQQAMEQMLRRVDDDPGGLLRQRFLLQHLRRHGRLPSGG